MKKLLLVVMMVWSITLNGAEGPGGEPAVARAAAAEKALADARAHQQEVQTELEKKQEEERAAQQRLDAVRAAAKQASDPAKAQAEVVAAQVAVTQIAAQVASQETVVAQAVQEASVAQAEAIKAQAQAGQSALPDSGSTTDQPVTVEDLTHQLVANKKAQDDLQQRITKGSKTKAGQKKLEDSLLEVKTKGELLVNAQDFLQFIAQKGLVAQFTEPELMNIFFQLGLPVVSADAIAGMDSLDLLDLKTQLRNAKSIVDSAQLDGSVLIKVGTIVTDEPMSAEDGYVVKGDVKFVKEDIYFDSPFTQEKKEALKRYLDEAIDRYDEAFGAADTKDDKSDMSVMQKQGAEDRLLALNELVKTIDSLINVSPVDEKAVVAEITSLLVIVTKTKEKLIQQGKEVEVSADAQSAVKALLAQCDVLNGRLSPLIDMTARLRDQALLNTGLLMMTMEYLFYVDSNPGLEKMTQSAALKLLLDGNTSGFTDTQLNFIETVRDQAVMLSALTELGSTSVTLDALQQQLSKLQSFYIETVQKTVWQDKDSTLIYGIFADGVKQQLDLLSFQVRVSKIQGDATFKIATVTDMHAVMDTLFYADPTNLVLQTRTQENALTVLSKGAPDTFTPEQKQFVSTVADQAKRFFALKAQAADALKNNDVIAMQDLQDEMRDLYEDIYMSRWSDKGLIDTQATFLADVQSTLNAIISQFGQAAKTLSAITQGKKGLLSQLVYSFKRFVTGKWGYSSEVADVKARGQGLQLYDFKKSAIADYVQEAQQIKASGDKEAQAALETEVAALKSIAQSGGVISAAKVQKSLSTDVLSGLKGSDLMSKMDHPGMKSFLVDVVQLMGIGNPAVDQNYCLDIIAALDKGIALDEDQQFLVENFYGLWGDKVKSTFTGLLDSSQLQALTAGTYGDKDVNAINFYFFRKLGYNQNDPLLVALGGHTLSSEQLTTIKSKMTFTFTDNTTPFFRLLAELNGVLSGYPMPDYLSLFDTPETRQYLQDAYNTGQDVSVDSAGAAQIVTALSSVFAQIPAA